MNVFLWIVQIVLAIMFLMAGVMKIGQPKEKLAENQGWVEDFAENHVKGVGALEILAAIGLILPGVTGIAPVLTPLAALGIAIVMGGAMATHWRRGEKQMVVMNVMLFVLAIIVVWGRFGPEPL